jgi:hypothetical protein
MERTDLDQAYLEIFGEHPDAPDVFRSLAYRRASGNSHRRRGGNSQRRLADLHLAPGARDAAPDRAAAADRSGRRSAVLLPGFAPATGLGRSAVNAYASRAGLTVGDFLKASPLVTTPKVAGAAITALATTDAREIAPAYLLSGDGLHALP